MKINGYSKITDYSETFELTSLHCTERRNYEWKLFF